MKIISKFKDYYDYLQGIHGVDDKLILDRTSFSPMMYKPTIKTVSTIHIGEYMVQGLWVNDVIYFGDDVEQFAFKDNTIDISDRHYDANHKSMKKQNWCIPNGTYSNMYCLKKPLFIGDDSPTWKEDCPILEGNRFGYYSKHPILKEYNIQKAMPPHEVWLILSEWLGKRITKNEPTVPVGDDKTRLLSAGFDLKTSFRH